MLSYAQKMHLIIYTTNQVIYFFKLIVFTIPCGSLLNGSVKYFLPNHRGVNIIQFRSILASFGSMYFFYFKAQMLEFQKIFLLVRFFNWISCNKGLKAKRPPEAGMFQKQKDRFIPDITQAEEIQKSTSTELHEWSENVVNVENHQFLKENCEFLSVI